VGQRVGIRTWLLLSGAVFTLVALVALSMARRRPVVAE
jgi:hypothetical protein